VGASPGLVEARRRQGVAEGVVVTDAESGLVSAAEVWLAGAGVHVGLGPGFGGAVGSHCGSAAGGVSDVAGAVVVGAVVVGGGSTGVEDGGLAGVDGSGDGVVGESDGLGDVEVGVGVGLGFGVTVTGGFGLGEVGVDDGDWGGVEGLDGFAGVPGGVVAVVGLLAGEVGSAPVLSPGGGVVSFWTLPWSPAGGAIVPGVSGIVTVDLLYDCIQRSTVDT
jgi:hypothetical protein